MTRMPQKIKVGDKVFFTLEDELKNILGGIFGGKVRSINLGTPPDGEVAQYGIVITTMYSIELSAPLDIPIGGGMLNLAIPGDVIWVDADKVKHINDVRFLSK